MFTVHHVGGRAGSRGFPVISGIEHDVVSVIYEADPDCIDQIVLYNGALGSETIVLPYALGADSCQQKLRLTYDPYASSLLEPKTDTGLFYIWEPLPALDYPVDKCFSVVREIPVQVRRLDDVVQINQVPPPDFLSIDVQGTELDVLVGCGVLLDTVVGVQVEVEFEELYIGQPLFSEVHDFMRRAGFVLMHIDGFPFDHAPPRRRQGARVMGLRGGSVPEASWGSL